MPKELRPGVLYVSEEFSTAAHLCACGCGQKVRTPLGPTEWTFTDLADGPTLDPSVGNWQQPCQSHYVIQEGRILWAGTWSRAQIAAGRQGEEHRRKAYYDAMYAKKGGFLAMVWRWILRLFGR